MEHQWAFTHYLSMMLLWLPLYQRHAAVTVDRETGNAGSVITVSGYDVKVRTVDCNLVE